MPCFAPIPAWRSSSGAISLKREGPTALHAVHLPCGSCLGCRKSRAREWALRCRLEASRHLLSSWVTLTYADEHVPVTLSKAHVSSYMRRLRKAIRPVQVRFFASGEYGERTHRPHYHAILFGLPETEQRVVKAWPYGFARVDPLTPAAISYVAGYCSKKIGYRLEQGERLDLETGELYQWQPPFTLMSRNPGIASSFRDHPASWRSHAVLDGITQPVPRYLHNSWLKSSTVVEISQLDEENQLKPHPSLSPYHLNASLLHAQRTHSLSSSRRNKL